MLEEPALSGRPPPGLQVLHPGRATGHPRWRAAGRARNKSVEVTAERARSALRRPAGRLRPGTPDFHDCPPSVCYTLAVRYLVTAQVKPGRAAALLDAIENRTLGAGSIAGGEYLRDMAHARCLPDGRVRWVEVCFCPTPLLEERPYWEEYFDLLKVQDAHARSRCRDLNGSEPWACVTCDCTARLEARLAREGAPFIETLPRPTSTDLACSTPGGRRARKAAQRAQVDSTR